MEKGGEGKIRDKGGAVRIRKENGGEGRRKGEERGVGRQGIPFTPPCHRRWDAAKGSEMQFVKKETFSPNFMPLEIKTSYNLTLVDLF